MLDPMLSRLIEDFHNSMNRATAEKAKADPKAYRHCQVMDGSARYHYYQQKFGRRIVRWCYTQGKNAAGFYLSFIEVHEGRVGGRTKFRGWSSKKDAIEDCRMRYDDSKKPKAERRFTIPTYKQIAAKH